MSTAQHAEAPALLTVAELAGRILRRADPESRASRLVVWKLCREGLPWVQVAGARLFRAEACIAWLERRSEAQAAARQQSAELAGMVAQAAASRARTPGRRAPPARRPSKGAPAKSLADLAGTIRRER